VIESNRATKKCIANILFLSGSWASYWGFWIFGDIPCCATEWHVSSPVAVTYYGSVCWMGSFHLFVSALWLFMRIPSLYLIDLFTVTSYLILHSCFVSCVCTLWSLLLCVHTFSCDSLVTCFDWLIPTHKLHFTFLLTLSLIWVQLTFSFSFSCSFSNVCICL